MNNEIKEILDNIKEIVDGYIEICNYNQDEVIYDEINYSPKQWYLLLDYITNLQQELEIMVKDDERSQETIIRLTKENERLKDSIDWWKDRFFGQQEYDDSHRITAIEYKKRIEKAIEYIKHCPEYLWANVNTKELLNILQKGIENEKSDD